MLGQVCCEQVLVPLGVCTSHSLVGLVWDWMPEGSLDSLLHEVSKFHACIKYHVLFEQMI